MRELFDINLLSEIKGLDMKMSVSREQVTLKKHVGNEQKHKGRQQNAKKSSLNQMQESLQDDEHPTINITVWKKYLHRKYFPTKRFIP